MPRLTRFLTPLQEDQRTPIEKIAQRYARRVRREARRKQIVHVSKIIGASIIGLCAVVLVVGIVLFMSPH